MNAHALLGLISDLYAQLTAAQERIAELEEQLATARADQAERHADQR